MIYVPYWIPVVVLAGVGTVSWMMPSRFALRTLLIAMTMLAALLGLIVALAKWASIVLYLAYQGGYNYQWIWFELVSVAVDMDGRGQPPHHPQPAKQSLV
jgi:hypothetical protein